MYVCVLKATILVCVLYNLIKNTRARIFKSREVVANKACGWLAFESKSFCFCLKALQYKGFLNFFCFCSNNFHWNLKEFNSINGGYNMVTGSQTNQSIYQYTGQANEKSLNNKYSNKSLNIEVISRVQPPLSPKENNQSRRLLQIDVHVRNNKGEGWKPP